MTNEETVRNKDVIKNLWLFIHDGALMHFAAIKQHFQKAAVGVYILKSSTSENSHCAFLYVRKQSF